MSILSGYKKVKDRILTSSGYQLLSRWTSSNTVDFDDGKTAQTKVGAINGIVKDKNSLSTVTDDSFAAGAVAVKDAIADINSNLQGLSTGNGNISHVYGGTKAHLWTDGEGGNLRLTSPDGSMYAELDCYNNTGLRIYTTGDGSKGIFIGTDGNLTVLKGGILFADEGKIAANGNVYMHCDGYTDWLSNILKAKANSSHTHDDRYYTETEVNNKLNSKSDTNHTHDDRYYTETEIDNKGFVNSVANGYIHVKTINKFSDSDNILYGCSNGRNYIVAVTVWSDEKIKKNIKDAQVRALDKLNAIKMREFDFTDESYGNHTECGYVAQELKEIFPEAVIEVPQSKEVTGYDTLCQVNDTKLIPYLVKAVQELSIKVKELEK